MLKVLISASSFFSFVDNIMFAHNDALKKLGLDYLEELRKLQEKAASMKNSKNKKNMDEDYYYEEPERSA